MWDNITAAVIKRLPAVYGLSLTSGPLRHAILALAAAYLGTEQHIEQTEFHAHQARRFLITRLATPSVIDEADVLGAFVLAIYAWTGPVSRKEIMIHVRGCASMLQTLSEKSRLSHVLRVFGPLIFDYLTLLDFWVKFDPRATFRVRCTVFNIFRSD